jgi:hypothetical protein
MLTIELHCFECADVRLFEQPPCEDRHGADCPEWVCTGCGVALLVGPPRPARSRRSRRQQPIHRRAA